MSLLKMKRKNVEDIGDDALQARVRAAEAIVAEIEAFDYVQVRGQEEQTVARLARALDVVEIGRAELASRHHRGVIEAAPARRRFQDEEAERDERERRLLPIRKALDFVTARAHPELAGRALAPDRLTEEEGEQLVELVANARALALEEGAEPLSEAEQKRYEVLVGTAAGEPELFAKKREEGAAKAKIAQLAKARKRHPQAENLVAAVLGDPRLHDLLHERIRENVTLIDDRGRETRGTTTERILELRHVSTLFVLLNAIVANGGHEIRVNSHGVLVERNSVDGRLPFLDLKTFPQLRRNGYITTRAEGSECVVGLGERVRKLARKWEITLPEG